MEIIARPGASLAQQGPGTHFKVLRGAEMSAGAFVSDAAPAPRCAPACELVADLESAREGRFRVAVPVNGEMVYLVCSAWRSRLPINISSTSQCRQAHPSQASLALRPFTSRSRKGTAKLWIGCATTARCWSSASCIPRASLTWTGGEAAVARRETAG